MVRCLVTCDAGLLAAACALLRVAFNVFPPGPIAVALAAKWYFGATWNLRYAVAADGSGEQRPFPCVRVANSAETITVNTRRRTPVSYDRLNSGTNIRSSLPQRAVSTTGRYLPDAFGRAI